jgi:signal transduction histidine kinase
MEQIVADRKTYNANLDGTASVHLPARIRDLQIDYTAFSLVAPEKVRFRYKLENHDREWQDVGTRRQAFYTDLPPGNYRFLVTASNNSGVWNETGASLDFSVDPAYYQTAWFRLSIVTAVIAFAALLYQLHLRRVARQYEVRLEERTRIAQDLHDTLLQGCLSASMQLSLAIDHLPEDLPIKKTLTHVQQVLAKATDEGRIAVRGLRVADPAALDLEQAFYRVRNEVATDQQIGFRVIVEGRRRPLHPLIRDEVYRIGREAIVNAYRHAQARQIEVEIDYAPRNLRLSVRDDGRGIDPAPTPSGLDGHYGLAGMRERAERIGGCVSILSRATAGTEVDLSVPGKVAFAVEPSRSLLWLKKVMGRTPGRA